MLRGSLRRSERRIEARIERARREAEVVASEGRVVVGGLRHAEHVVAGDRWPRENRKHAREEERKRQRDVHDPRPPSEPSDDATREVVEGRGWPRERVGLSS